MTDQHDEHSAPSTSSTEPTAGTGPSPRSRWRRGWRPVTATAVVVALAGGWAVSSIPGVHSAGDSVSATLDEWTGHSAAAAPANPVPANTAPVDEVFQQDLDALLSRDGLAGVEAFVRNADGTVHSYTSGVGK